MNSLDDIKLRVFRLLDLISSTNQAIAFHQERGQKGLSAVQQYLELKRRYEDELFEILANEVGVQFPVALAA
jgi:hypothetical protein